MIEFSKQKLIYIILGLIITFFFILAIQNINSPFIHVSEDTNGQNGLAALNILKHGINTTKLGLYVSWIDDGKKFNDLTGNFYAHHPAFFIIPTTILYKIFSINEATTRLGPLLLMIIALILFSLALKIIFRENLFLVIVSLLILIILPGFVYYSKHLDPSPPVLAFALITYSLFIFYYFNPSKKYFYLFFISIILGIAMGWHYAFMPVMIWLFILFTPKGKLIHQKKYFLLFIPFVLFLAILIQLGHIYILNGKEAIFDLFKAYGGRSGSYINKLMWWKVLYGRAKLLFTSLFFYGFLLGIILFLYELFNSFTKNQIKNKNLIPLKQSNKVFISHSEYLQFIIPLILMPIIITLLFQQWSTHPFGLMFYLPAVAILSGFVLYKIYQKNNGVGILITTIVLTIGFFMALSNLNFFYKDFLILNPNDITLLKELKNNINSNELCLGRNQILYFGGIVGFYLQKEISLSPDCIKNNNTKYVLALHPKFDELAAQDFELFNKNNFKLQGCSGAFCLMQK